MNALLAERWATALESGDYQQGTQWLHSTENTYCCLGVLCDITKEETGGEWSPGRPFAFIDPLNAEVRQATGLPKFVRDVVGLGSLGEPLSGRVYNVDGVEYSRLSTANDKNESFKDIAAAIRERYVDAKS